MIGTWGGHAIGTGTGIGIGGGNGGSTATLPGVALADEDAVTEHGDRLLDGPERPGSVDLSTVRGRSHAGAACDKDCGFSSRVDQDCKQHKHSGGIYGAK